MNHKAGFLTLLFLGLLIVPGCWNYREINEMALMLGMGIDYISESDDYRVTAHIVNAKEIAGRTAHGKALPVVSYSGNGKTLIEAIRRTSKGVPRRINGQHMRVVVIGEPLAKRGIKEFFDFLERDHEHRMTTRVFVAKGTEAEKILETLTVIEDVTPNAILGELKTSGNILGEGYEVKIEDVIWGLLTKGGGPVISGVKLTGDLQAARKKSNLERTDLPADLFVDEMALFKEGKLAGWVNNSSARGVSWINNKLKSSIVTLDCGQQKDALAIEILRSRTRVKAELQGEQPVIHIHIQQTGTLGEALCPIDLDKAAELQKLEEGWNKATKHDVMAAVREAKRLKTDVLGFGAAVERANPKAWKRMEKEWDRIFATCKVEVNVDTNVYRTGMRSRPYLFMQ